MLRITDLARSFLDDVRSAQGIPDHYGIRVFTAAGLNGAAPVQIMFRDTPLTGDDINEAAGTRVFVSPEISGVISCSTSIGVRAGRSSFFEHLEHHEGPRRRHLRNGKLFGLMTDPAWCERWPENPHPATTRLADICSRDLLTLPVTT